MKNNRFDLVTGDNRNHDLGLFDPFFGDFFDFPVMDRKEWHRMKNIMKTDVKEGKDNYTLEIEMPGINKKDINLDLRDGYLTVSAKREHHEETENKNENYIRRERSYGQFSRSFYVGNVEQKDVDASLENGVLHIVLPKEQKKVENSNRNYISFDVFIIVYIF